MRRAIIIMTNQIPSPNDQLQFLYPVQFEDSGSTHEATFPEIIDSASRIVVLHAVRYFTAVKRAVSVVPCRRSSPLMQSAYARCPSLSTYRINWPRMQALQMSGMTSPMTLRDTRRHCKAASFIRSNIVYIWGKMGKC